MHHGTFCFQGDGSRIYTLTSQGSLIVEGSTILSDKSDIDQKAMVNSHCHHITFTKG